MKTYEIQIYSLGYENTGLRVQRESKNRITKTDILRAKVEWCKHNDVDEDSIELPFHRIVEIK